MTQVSMSRRDQVEHLVELLREGGQKSVTAHLMTVCLDEFGISAPEAFKRIRDAKAKLATGLDAVDRSEEMAATLARWESVFAGAMRSEDWGSACKALQGICNMLGLKP
ncbi:hypothetical protein S2L_36 [Cyanophage S-2L]|nr:hypothetical protein S2L_36 [Cyanophage S-2L]